MSSDLQSISVEIRRMTAAARQCLPQPLDAHQSFRAMSQKLREMQTQLKHAYLTALTHRRPKVHKSLAPCTGITVSPLTPRESARFYDWMNRRPAAR